MALSPGERLGPYEIVGALGAGGMGEVYRARDGKLGREVAIKVLPEPVAADPERLARFRREAQVLASLNHPNIAQVYGFEDANVTHALVMELVDGETLADRLATGPLPAGETLAIAKQITEALEAAHEQGIIHRDLKPANVKLRPDGAVKVLDFGLAKAMEQGLGAGDRGSGSASLSPTITSPAMMTGAGMLLGTAAYMAPEQARGRNVDRRADIWAFGVVLFEMLSGSRAFDNEDLTGTLAYVITKEPDWDALPASTSPAIRKLLRRCLEKDPKKRLQGIGDARLELEDVLAGRDAVASVGPPSAAVAPPARRWPWIAAVSMLAIVAIAAATVAYRATRPVAHSLIRLTESFPVDVSVVGPSIALSPDGTRIAYVREGRIAMRRLEDDAPNFLAGTDGGVAPFFSPDGLWIGFFTTTQIKKVSVNGGSPMTVGPIDGAPRGGGFWTEDGRILFALQRTGVLSVRDSGGPVTPLTTLDTSKREVSHRAAQVLPGDLLLFESSDDNNTWGNARIHIQSLKSGERRTLASDAFFPRYIHRTGDDRGYLLYLSQSTMFAAPLTPANLAISGTALPVLESVSGRQGNGIGQFAVAGDGSMVYLRGSDESVGTVMFWIEESGTVTSVDAPPAEYRSAQVSPDGSRIAAVWMEAGTSTAGIYEWMAKRMTRLTHLKSVNDQIRWAVDGQHIVALQTNDPPGIYWWRSDGTGTGVRLVEGPNFTTGGFSPDGKVLAFIGTAPPSLGLWTVTLDLGDREHPKPGKPVRLVDGRVDFFSGSFSTDGRWIAYSATESGMRESYVIPYPGPGGRVQVSNGGGKPVWLPNGREMLYISGRPSDRGPAQLMVLPFSVKGDVFTGGQPRPWAKAAFPPIVGAPSLSPAPDGKRVLNLMPQLPAAGKAADPSSATFLLHWVDELERRVKPTASP